ncbi:MAG: PAS domain S-box protein [Gemmatimonadaceae bacterium]|nr:PAS domain S-box protein [Gemmatimonadaceae bacterium]
MSSRPEAEPADVALLSTIVETAGSVILGLRPNHQIFLWNRAAEELYSVSRQEAMGTDYVARFIAPEHQAFVAADIVEVLAGKRTLNFEDDSVLQDGSRRTLIWNVTRVLAADGSPFGIVAIGQDITERKHAEERFRLVFESAQDGLLLSDHTGVVDCNPAALTMLGLEDKSQLVGHRPAEFSPAFQPDGAISDEKSRSLGKLTLSQGALTFDWVHQRADGTPVPVEVSVRHATLMGKRVSVVAWRDQTRRLELERERATIQERLDLAQKMEAIGQLAGGVAHDFNNLLAAIRNAVELAKDVLPDADAARVDLDVALSTTDRASRLTRQLLAFSRQQPRAVEQVDLAALVRDMAGLLRTSMPSAVQLNIHASADRPAWVLADRSQLEQVVLNLALNARDAMPHGGSLDIQVQCDDLRLQVALIVTDTGTGIDEVTKQRIFEPFFSTKPMGAGSGLGLSVVYGVVTQAGGTIRVESEPGRGTTMRVAFPLATGFAARRTTPVHGAVNVPHGLLLVDDDDAVRRTTRRLLERHGWAIMEAANGEEALELFVAHREQLAIILTDVRMPVLDGVALARRVRAVAPDFPLVFFSGYDELEQQDVVGLSSVPLLAKPFAANELLSVLQRALVAAG